MCRQREDTVRCIVSSLTEEGSSELSDELVKGHPLVLDDSYCSDDDAAPSGTVAPDAAAEVGGKGDSWETWMPDPVDADPGTEVLC